MKKLIAAMIATTCILSTALAQSGIKDYPVAAYYGIDFSNSKVFGAAETDMQFRTAFEQMNILVLNEAKKYDLNKAFGKSFPIQNIQRANERIALNQDLRTDNKNYRLSDEQVRGIISAYGGHDEPAGMVIICELLNKQDNQGIWRVVFFDMETHEIIYSKTATGKSGGFGLRNFWAGSFYQVLKKWKY